jgi:hypothetical protein
MEGTSRVYWEVVDLYLWERCLVTLLAFVLDTLRTSRKLTGKENKVCFVFFARGQLQSIEIRIRYADVLCLTWERLLEIIIFEFEDRDIVPPR